MAWAVEYTDTFAGEANYCWVRRATIGARKDESQRSIMRRAKAAVSVAGLKGRTQSHGDAFEFRPYGICTILFVTWSDWREEDSAADAMELAKS